ncbi:MAG: cation:proton antiporter, partial [Planctomycetes bacterium]|nr:cation:proton antiporter [Planctomycetota bacterium]
MSPAANIGWALLVPVIAALGVAIAGCKVDERDAAQQPGGLIGNANLRDGVTVVAGLVTLALVLRLLPAVLAGESPSLELVEVLPGVMLAFSLEPLGMLFALVASCLWIPTSIYAFGYMRGHHEKNQTRFFVCFAIAIAAALGIAFARNLFTLFLFYEVLTFSTYPLVTHDGTEKAKRAGRVYLGVLVFTSVTFLLLAIVWTWQMTGTLEFTRGGILAGHAEGTEVIVLLALFAFGTGKAALMPFHRWLPNAMVAPTPVSALLHAVAVVKAGVFTVLKVVVYVFGIDFLANGNYSNWLCWVASFTLLASSAIALTKDNLKARLAYSTISQLAYIVLGAALATQDSVIGAGMHIAMHALGKITLFFCAGSIIVFAHKTEISTMDGIGRRMPWTMAAFFLASLSIIGLPPMGGSWSKWYLALGAVESDQAIFIGVLMLSSLLSIGYLMPVVARGFFMPPKPWTDEHGHERAAQTEYSEGSPLCTVPLCLTALGCIAMFFYGSELRALLLP